MNTIWDAMGTWVDRVGEAALAAVDEVGNQSLVWLDDALDGRSSDEVGAFVAELDRVPLLSVMMRESRCRRPGATVAYGDVIGVQRLGYTHYGIYASEEAVIHYVGNQNETDMDAMVRETSLVTFLRGDEDWFVLDLDERATDNVAALHGDYEMVETYSPDETVRRARSRLGESRYNLLWNNCEHFALWCKTGREESDQVGSMLEAAGQIARLLLERR